MRSSLRPDIQIYSRFEALKSISESTRKIETKQDFMNVSDAIGVPWARKQTRKYFHITIPPDAARFFAAQDRPAFIEKIIGRKICIETEKYSDKFSRKNCYITYNGKFMLFDTYVK